jgi:dipeptidyl aminopeptidase/acylaminoacyl peptidase
MRAVVSFAFVLALMVGSCVPGSTATRPPLEARELLSLAHFPFTYFGAATTTISPDGTLIAYAIESEAPTEIWAGQKARTEIFVQPYGGGTPISIAVGTANSYTPVWSPDSKKLAFFSGFDRSAKVAIWDVATKTATAVDDLPIQLPSRPVMWLPDARRLIVTRPHRLLPAPIASGAVTASAAPVGSVPTAEPTAAVTVLTSHPSSAQRREADAVKRYPVDETRTVDLVLLDLQAASQTVLAENLDLSTSFLSPDGKKLLYLTRMGIISGDINSRAMYDLHLVELATATAKVVARDILANAGPSIAWSHDGSKVAYAGGHYPEDATVQSGDFGSSRPGSVYLIDLTRTSALRRISPALFSRGRELAWSANDATIYAQTLEKDGSATRILGVSSAGGAPKTVLSLTDGAFWPGYVHVATHRYARAIADSGEVRFYDVTRESTRPAATSLQWMDDLEFSRDGSHAVYQGQDVGHPPDVWTMDGGFHAPRQITHLNPQLEGRGLSDRVKTITWHTPRGQTSTGVILLPVDYRPGRRYPMIAWVYGGEKWASSSRTRFGMSLGAAAYFNLELFATRGYAMFIPNSSIRVGHPMEDIATGILPGIDAAVAAGVADPQRIGVWGQSYGGYSTFSLIVQSKRFAAAVAMVGVVDLMTFYGSLFPDGSDWTGWTETEQGRMGGTPWQYRDRYVQNSPVYYLDRVTTPVLIEYGATDSISNFNMPEAFVDLRRLNKEATLLKYAGEGHVLIAPANQLDFASRMLRWFEKYLCPSRGGSGACP